MKRKLRIALRWARDHPGRTRALAFLVALLLGATAFLAPYASGDGVRQLSAYGEGHRDASAFRTTLEDAGVTVRSAATSPYMLGSLSASERSALVILGVERPYTDGEIDDILAFVHRGGSLVLADDTGNARGITSRFNYSIDGFPVLEEKRNHLNDPRFPVTTATLDGGAYRLLLNAPSRLYFIEGTPGEVLARSSDESYLDTDHDGEINLQTPTGPFDLIVRTTYGNGQVILLADPGLFMNDVYTLSGYQNEAFGRALVAPLVEEGGVLVFDESRHMHPPQVATINTAMRALVIVSSTPVWNWVLAGLAIALAAAAVYLTRETEDWRHHEFSLGERLEAPEEVRPDADRVAALATRAVSERYNISAESLQALSQQEVASLTGDPSLAALVKGELRGAEATRLLLTLNDSPSSSSAPTTPEASP